MDKKWSIFLIEVSRDQGFFHSRSLIPSRGSIYPLVQVCAHVFGQMHDDICRTQVCDTHDWYRLLGAGLDLLCWIVYIQPGNGCINFPSWKIKKEDCSLSAQQQQGLLWCIVWCRHAGCMHAWAGMGSCRCSSRELLQKELNGMKLYWSCSQAGAEQEQAAPVEGFCEVSWSKA
jgi:hypothetical protein